jgi:hypothetical protein
VNVAGALAPTSGRAPASAYEVLSTDSPEIRAAKEQYNAMKGRAV